MSRDNSGTPLAPIRSGRTLDKWPGETFMADNQRNQNQNQDQNPNRDRNPSEGQHRQGGQQPGQQGTSYPQHDRDRTTGREDQHDRQERERSQGDQQGHQDNRQNQNR